jgi:hypothetical protein
MKGKEELEFDKCKIWKIYFEHNNIDQILKKYNQQVLFNLA